MTYYYNKCTGEVMFKGRILNMNWAPLTNPIYNMIVDEVKHENNRGCITYSDGALIVRYNEALFAFGEDTICDIHNHAEIPYVQFSTVKNLWSNSNRLHRSQYKLK